MAISSGNPNRQKMINLMYIVFIALMILNVSSDVLDGYVRINKRINHTIDFIDYRNKDILSQIATAAQVNPKKVKTIYDKALIISQKADSIVNYINHLRKEIAIYTDGSGANPDSIDRQSYKEASGEIMLSPINQGASHLQSYMNHYKSLIALYIYDVGVRKLCSSMLDISNYNGVSWGKKTFDKMPTVASLSILSQIISDIRCTESIVLQYLLAEIDAKDYAVNELSAEVVPLSRNVIQGENYEGKVILSSIDTTLRPQIFINNKKLPDDSLGTFAIPTNKVGHFILSGYMLITTKEGGHLKRNFSTQYNVLEPMVSIAPRLMNVLYAGIPNKIDIAVPGLSSEALLLSADNGQIYREKDYWVVKPLKVGQNLIISVRSKMPDGNIRLIGKKKFYVRPLPDPMAYIALNQGKSTIQKIKNGRIDKKQLLQVGQISAAIDDGILDIPFNVIRFTVIVFDSMGNAIPEVSQSNKFSPSQLIQIRRVSSGRKLYITDIQVKGPDGSIRQISPMELTII